MMKTMNFESFLNDFGRAAKPNLDMSIYRDNFQCSCGKSHWFDESIDIICEGLMKVIVVCPDDSSHLTNLKIKTFLLVKFKGFESLAGTQLKTQSDVETLMTMRALFRR